VTKLLVSAALTLSFAAGLAQGDNTADAGETFALANGLAKVNALQNEPLGEVLAAAQETLEHMRRVRIPVMVDLSLLVNATTPTTQQTPEPSTASRS
jgi:hypothetical protein